jgi:hypothetical protein
MQQLQVEQTIPNEELTGKSDSAVINYKQTAFKTDFAWFFIEVQGMSKKVKNKEYPTYFVYSQ